MPRSVPPLIAALVTAVVALGLPAAAGAYPPVVSLSSVQASGSTTAVVQTQISPSGEDTTYYVAYDELGSPWCASSGASGTPTYTTTPVDFGSVDTGQFLAIPLSGLISDVQYCADIYATNADGTEDSGQMTWWQSEPSVDTTGLTQTGSTTATIQGQVNPDHQDTSYFARYAPASSEWCTSSGASGNDFFVSYSGSLNSSDDTFQDVSVQLYGMTPGTSYCAAIVSSSGYEEFVSGGQLTWTQSFPTAQTWDAYSTSPSEATVEGEVNPVGDATTAYQVQYAPASSPWCTSGGTSGSADTTSTTAAGLDLTSTSLQYVAAGVTGLTEGDNYCARLIATNDDGESDGQQVWWTQGLAATDTYTGDSTGTTTATVTGDVDPAGQATTYQVDYDLGDSSWCQTGSGSAAHSTATTSVPGQDGNTFYPVSVDLSGLTPGEYYCADVVATNAAGTYESFPVYWSQPMPPPPPPALTVTVTGTGTVTSSPAGIDCGNGATACSYAFSVGTKVTLTATPATGGSFSLWTLAPGCTTAHATTCTFTYEGSQTIGAIFTTVIPSAGVVGVVFGGSGSGAVTSDPAGIACESSATSCSYLFTMGTQLTLTAVPDSNLGSTFLGWSGDGCSDTSTCTITVGSGTTTITADFGSPVPHCTVKPKSASVPLKGRARGTLTLTVECNQDVTFALYTYVTVRWDLPKSKSPHPNKRPRTTSHVWSPAELHGKAQADTATTVTVKLPNAALTRLSDKHISASADFEFDASDDSGDTPLSVHLKDLK